MKLTWLALCGATALLLSAGAAAADTNQFGPFADDRLYLEEYDFDFQSPATEDTKAEVYDGVYEHDYLYGDEYINDLDPELWVGAGSGFYVN